MYYHNGDEWRWEDEFKVVFLLRDASCHLEMVFPETDEYLKLKKLGISATEVEIFPAFAYDHLPRITPNYIRIASGIRTELVKLAIRKHLNEIFEKIEAYMMEELLEEYDSAK